jgi:2-dehydro-3-deoxygluconokinase
MAKEGITVETNILAHYKKICNMVEGDVSAEVTTVVDRVGSGDAFMGALIYGLLEYENDFIKTLNFAIAACCLKHTIYGDYNLATLEEITQLALGNTSAKVSR